MTLSYSGRFLGLLFRWRGSVWRSVGLDLFIYLILYYAINIPYRFVMDDDQKRTFEEIVVYVSDKTSYIPLTFLLGFFVYEVVSRWYKMLDTIAWPDSLMVRILVYLPGDGEDMRLARRTIARWANLSAVMCWRLVTIRVKRRFPTDDHLVGAGLLTEEEKKLLDSNSDKHGNWFIPLVWCLNLARRLADDEKISPQGLKEIVWQVNTFRSSCGSLLVYDWVCIPLVYSQVTAIAVYGFFAVCLVGRQLLDESQQIPGFELDTYVPVFTILQFIFYYGWMKVGEDLMRPLGEDDDDFEFNYILDRNIHIAFMYADTLYDQCPEATKDIFWEEKNPELPYTLASLQRMDILPVSNIPPREMKRAMKKSKMSELVKEQEERKRLIAEIRRRKRNPFYWLVGGGGGKKKPAKSAKVKPEAAKAEDGEANKEKKDGKDEAKKDEKDEKKEDVIKEESEKNLEELTEEELNKKLDKLEKENKDEEKKEEKGEKKEKKTVTIVEELNESKSSEELEELTDAELEEKVQKIEDKMNSSSDDKEDEVIEIEKADEDEKKTKKGDKEKSDK